MKNTFLTSVLLLICIQINAQSKIIGNVYYQNSDWRPVEGVLVNAEGSNGDYSKTEGGFTLIFSHFDIGSVVYPFIGENNLAIDKNGVEVELVNEKELQYVSIPKYPKEAPLKIIICRRGDRNLAAIRYYNIIKTQSEIKLRQKKAEVEMLREKLGIANDLVLKKSKELEIYKNINDSISIYKEAFRIAGINRDGAKQRVINYLDALDAGLSIEEARKELNSKMAYSEALSGISNVNSSIQELTMNAKGYETQLKFEEAFYQYDTIAKILNHHVVNPLLQIDNYIMAGALANTLNKHEKALEYYSYAMLTINKKGINKNNVKSLALFKLGRVNYFLKNTSKAVNFLKQSLENFDSSSPNEHAILLGKINANLGYVYMYQKKYIEAEIHLKEALRILKPIKEDYFEEISVEFISIYEKLSALYMLKNNQAKSQEMLWASIKILEGLKKDYPTKYDAHSARIYSALGHQLVGLQNYENAVIAYNLAADIEHELALNNPQKYNLQYAETLEFLILVKIGQLTKKTEDGNEYKEQAIEISKKIKKLLSIYPNSNKRASDLLKSNQEYARFLNSYDILNDEDEISDNVFIALLNLDREVQQIENQIGLGSDSKKALDQRQRLHAKIEKLFLKYPNEHQVLNQLLASYAKVATTAIDAKQYDTSIKAINKLTEFDTNRIWEGFAPLVLVNAYVLKGRADKAWPIYKKYKNLILPNSTLTYRDSFLADIRDLEQKGIHHKDFAKIKEFLTN